MPVDWVRRASYVFPYGLIALLAWLGDLSWWAIAMLAGGFVFAWDWLWGDRHLLDAKICLVLMGGGLACIAVAFYLADGLSLSLGEFSKLAGQLPRRQRLLYHLPSIGVGLALYGLLGWSRAWFPRKEWTLTSCAASNGAVPAGFPHLDCGFRMQLCRHGYE